MFTDRKHADRAKIRQEVLRLAVRIKLTPTRFPQMSPRMAAIVGCIVGETFTTPSLAELAITSDGLVLGRASHDCGMNEWIGTAAALERNWNNLLTAAGLTPAEQIAAKQLYAEMVQDWRR